MFSGTRSSIIPSMAAHPRTNGRLMPPCRWSCLLAVPQMRHLILRWFQDTECKAITMHGACATMADLQVYIVGIFSLFLHPVSGG